MFTIIIISQALNTHDGGGREPDLSGEDHVDALELDELGELGQEGEDVRHLGAGRQVAHAYTVPARAVRDEVLGHADGDGGGRQLCDQGLGQLTFRLLRVARVHAAVQNLSQAHGNVQNLPQAHRHVLHARQMERG